jgi:hypothetical protein
MIGEKEPAFLKVFSDQYSAFTASTPLITDARITECQLL